jgi:NAD+ kinase
MSEFKTIGVLAKRGDPRIAPTLEKLLDHLAARRLAVLLDESVIELLPARADALATRPVMAERCDLAIVVGGDGTFLNAARGLVDTTAPLLGINLGRLGFLVDVSPEEMHARLDEILDGRHAIEERGLLTAQVLRDGQLLGEGDALNDVVLHIRDVVRMIEFEIFIDERFVSRQRADGLVVATPTGSTAYALSGGGPLVDPALDAHVLVPICPHTLSHRPIVVGGASRIEVRLSAESATAAQVAFDGQANLDVQAGDRVVIERHARPVRLIHPAGYDYFEILRAKLRWGEQP